MPDDSISIACHSSARDDTNFETCSSWCTSKYSDAHCEMCACKRCDFCRIALESRVACSSHAPARSDTTYEKCDSFCNARFAEVHCSLCRCRGCGFCDDVAMCDPAQVTDCACDPETPKDSKTMQVCAAAGVRVAPQSLRRPLRSVVPLRFACCALTLLLTQSCPIRLATHLFTVCTVLQERLALLALQMRCMQSALC